MVVVVVFGLDRILIAVQSDIAGIEILQRRIVPVSDEHHEAAFVADLFPQKAVVQRVHQASSGSVMVSNSS